MLSPVGKAGLVEAVSLGLVGRVGELRVRVVAFLAQDADFGAFSDDDAGLAALVEDGGLAGLAEGEGLEVVVGHDVDGDGVELGSAGLGDEGHEHLAHALGAGVLGRLGGRADELVEAGAVGVVAVVSDGEVVADVATVLHVFGETAYQGRADAAGGGVEVDALDGADVVGGEEVAIDRDALAVAHLEEVAWWRWGR